MAHKNLEDRKKYMESYYLRHREKIIARTRAYGKTHPRKRRNFKNKMWCKNEDKPLWKKIFRKWLHYAHDVPHLLDVAVANIKNISEKDYFEKKKSTPQERYARHKAARARWLAKPGVRDRERRKRNFKRLKINGGLDKYYSNPDERLKILLRGRLYRLTSAKNFRRSHSMLELLGCSIAELRTHLEKQFESEMSWSNYGDGNGKRWQVDHITACRRFWLDKLEHQRVCFHFSNLRPLWQQLNERKDSHPAIPRFTDEEVSVMHQKIYGTDIVPIDFPATTAGITQPNKAAGSLQNTSAQLGLT